MKRKVNKIYLHWTGTRKDWARAGSYHSVITGDGKVHRLTPYSLHQGGSTYNRNTGAISLSMACMAGSHGNYEWPDDNQIDSLCKEAAKVALGLGWQADLEFLHYKIMTHAEAAANRDFPRSLVEKFSLKTPSSNWDVAAQRAGLPHANYSIPTWHDGWPGGDSVRWDLSQLRPSDTHGTGGYELRERIVSWMKQIQKNLSQKKS